VDEGVEATIPDLEESPDEVAIVAYELFPQIKDVHALVLRTTLS
jgi:hypothetical protein